MVGAVVVLYILVVSPVKMLADVCADAIISGAIGIETEVNESSLTALISIFRFTSILLAPFEESFRCC